MKYHRIQIVGPSGSGKTTLAKELSREFGIPHYELDSIFWLPEWQEKPTIEFRREVLSIIKKPNWILCGDYIDRLNGLTLKYVDVVIWLNYTPRVFVPRMMVRTIRRWITREKILGNNKESQINFWFRPSKSLLFITLKLYKTGGRRRQEAKISKYQYTGQIIEIKSPRELKKWLKSI